MKTTVGPGKKWNHVEMSVMSQMGSDPQWIASGFQTEDLNLEFSYIDANFTNTTGGTVFVGVWTGVLQAFSVDWVLLKSINIH
jgi:hypothetical protein